MNYKDRNGDMININNNDERYLLRELLIQLGKSPDDMSWEELIYENWHLSQEFTQYVNYKRSVKEPFFDGPINKVNTQANTQNIEEKKYKTVMCRSIVQGIVCRYGDRCRFAHSENEINPTKLNYNAKSFVPSHGLLSMSNLTNILEDIDINEVKKDNGKTIDLVLEEIKENDRCEDFISKLKKLNISSPKNTEVKEEEVKVVEVKKEQVKVETKTEEVKVEEVKVVEVKKEQVKVETKTEEVKVEEVKKETVVAVKVETKTEEVKVEEVKKEKIELKNDGICRAKVATTKVRCTAPCKIGMLCGRHKNYTGKLME